MLVDSDRDNRVMTTLSLEMLGAIVISVTSVREAIIYLNREQFHILISDLVLPEEDGCSLIRQVRGLAKEERSNIPAIALTACKVDRLCEHAIAAGFDLYQEKPLLTDDLAMAIISLLSFHRTREGQTSTLQPYVVCSD